MHRKLVGAPKVGGHHHRSLASHSQIEVLLAAFRRFETEDVISILELTLAPGKRVSYDLPPIWRAALLRSRRTLELDSVKRRVSYLQQEFLIGTKIRREAEPQPDGGSGETKAWHCLRTAPELRSPHLFETELCGGVYKDLEVRS
jgi:hypothetical protein